MSGCDVTESASKSVTAVVQAAGVLMLSMGAEVATADDAREILDLKPRPS